MKCTSKNNDAQSSRLASTEEAAHKLFLRASEGYKEEEATATYMQRLPEFLKLGDISYAFKAMKFPGAAQNISQYEPMIAEAVPEWIKNRDTGSIIAAKTTLNWTKKELSQFSQLVMQALAETVNATLENLTDREYREQGGLERDLRFISESISTFELSKEELSHSQFKQLIRKAIISSLGRNAGGISCALKIKSACDISNAEFILWIVLRQA